MICGITGSRLIKARTGTGKTLTFVVPILHHLVTNCHVERNQGTLALMLAPTRELAVQISNVLDAAATLCPFVVTGNISGGLSRKAEVRFATHAFAEHVQEHTNHV